MEPRLKKSMTSKAQKQAHDYGRRLSEERLARGFELGRLALEVGPSRAARFQETTVARARYWRLKVLDPDFHAAQWGGQRSENVSLFLFFFFFFCSFSFLCAFSR